MGVRQVKTDASGSEISAVAKEFVVSVVIPCLNEANSVGICIDKARAAFDAAALSGEVVVADNGSTDGSQEIAQSHGARLVYPMQDRAMQFFNLLANKLFGVTFTWLLRQSVKDSLCGTKVLSKQHYEMIAANRAYFGELDPFGDFDLLFGAAKYNLKIVDVPIRYRERTYGTTNIQRWSHGWLLLRMVLLAMPKMKFV